MRSKTLSEIYVLHNQKRSQNFIYGGEDRLRAMRQLLPSRLDAVLDLGCRDGALAAGLGIPSDRVIGVDIDTQSLARAAAQKRLAPCVADLWAPLPFRAASFDLVLAGEVLEHLPFPDRVVDEIVRVLQPSGAFLGSVPNTYRLKNRLRFLAGQPYESDPTHLRQFSPKSLRGMLEQRFRSVEIHPCVGRFASLAPGLMANDLVWRSAGPRDQNV